MTEKNEKLNEVKEKASKTIGEIKTGFKPDEGTTGFKAFMSRIKNLWGSSFIGKISIVVVGLIIFFIVFGLPGGVKLTDIEKTQYENSGFTTKEAKKWKKAGFTWNNASQYKDKGFTLIEATEWKKGGYDFYDARNWKKAGFKIDEVKIWKDEGFSEREAASWKLIATNITNTKMLLKAGFDRGNPRHALCLKDIGFELKAIIELKKSGFDCQDAKGWKQAGFSSDEMIRLSKTELDVRGYSKAEPWRMEGFSIDEIEVLMNGGFGSHMLSSAVKYKSAGFSAHEIIKLKKSRIDSNVAADWKNSGFSTDDIVQLKNANIRNSEAISWKSGGFSTERMLKYFLIGFRGNQVEYANIWESTGFEIPQIKTLLDNGFQITSATEIVEYQKLKLDSPTIIALKNKGFRLQDLQESINSGMSANDFIIFSNSGWPKNEIIGWTSIGINYETAKEWKTLDFSYMNVKRLKVYNIDIDELKKWTKAGYSANEAIFWKSAGLSLAEVSNLSIDDKLLYILNFKGIRLGMETKEAFQKLEAFANTNRLYFYLHNIIMGPNKNLLVSLKEDETKKTIKKISIVSTFFPNMKYGTDYNEYGYDKDKIKNYLESKCKIKFNKKNSFEGEKLSINLGDTYVTYELK